MSKVRISSWCFVGLLALSTSCASPKDEEFGMSLVDSLMIEVMVDIHLVNARAELGYGWKETSLDTIITRHGLSQKEYEDQIMFYTEHPDTYLAVLNKAMERMGQNARALSGY